MFKIGDVIESKWDDVFLIVDEDFAHYIAFELYSASLIPDNSMKPFKIYKYYLSEHHVYV